MKKTEMPKTTMTRSARMMKHEANMTGEVVFERLVLGEWQSGSKISIFNRVVPIMYTPGGAGTNRVKG